MKTKYLPVLLLLALAQGCAGIPANTSRQTANDEASKEKMRAVHSDLIAQMIEQGNYHAALAHIEELKRGDTRVDKISLLHARVLFRMGRAQEAHAEYAKLMGTAFDADAMHGIGLIYTVTNPSLALDYLGKAARGAPTRAGIRNDYGYALLRQGGFDKAKVELATAHELAPEDSRYRNNAILACLLAEDYESAQELASRGQLSKSAYRRLRKQAEVWDVSVIDKPQSRAIQVKDAKSPTENASTVNVDPI